MIFFIPHFSASLCLYHGKAPAQGQSHYADDYQIGEQGLAAKFLP